MRKYDLYGGLIIALAIASGVAEVMVRGMEQMIVPDLAPYALFAILGLVIASLGEDDNAQS
jgi:hypothetical protein